jgi:hypothetical protein
MDLKEAWNFSGDSLQMPDGVGYFPGGAEDAGEVEQCVFHDGGLGWLS